MISKNVTKDDTLPSSNDGLTSENNTLTFENNTVAHKNNNSTLENNNLTHENNVLKPQTTKKQLGIFLLLCLPVTWLLMGISYMMDSNDKATAFSIALLSLGCCVPAIAGVLTCVITKEKLFQLNFFPKLPGNGLVYFLAIISGVMLSLMPTLLTVMFFSDVQSFYEDTGTLTISFTILLYTAVGIMQSFLLLGEEIGWMGYLFPKLETLYGTGISIIFTAIIRTLWHLVMLIQMEDFLFNLLSLFLSNLVLGSLLILLTKASGSVVPAAITHALTNTVPMALNGFLVTDNVLYQANHMEIYFVTLIPELILGVVCYFILVRKRGTLN